MRVLLLAVLLVISVSVAGVYAQTPASTSVSIGVSPRVADAGTARVVQISGLSPSSQPTILLFDPTGAETNVQGQANASGELQINLAVPPGGWHPGLYRVVVETSSHNAVSATFAGNDQGPHLDAEPFEPSVTSAIVITGTGLPAGSPVGLVLHLGDGRGDIPLTVSTDAGGIFSLVVWPQQVGQPFFSAGIYSARIPALHLEAVITIREHPAYGLLSAASPVVAGGVLAVHLRGYHPFRTIYAAYSDLNGTVRGELLLGETNLSGTLDVAVTLPSLPAGQYLLATPYDWGETTFTVLAPTPTDTATPTATPSPTATATPTVTPTLAPARTTSTHKRCKGKGKHRKCKRVHH